MTKILVIAGHGQGATYDPGAVGVQGIKEAEEVRYLMSRMSHYAAGEISFYTARDVFADRSLYQVAQGYDEVVEIHFNAFNGNAKGTEILIHESYDADETDKRLLRVLSQYWTPRNGGFKKVNNIYNVNIAKQRGLSYRLVEICFIDNVADMQKYHEVREDLARNLVQALLNSKVSGVSATKAGWVRHHDGRYWYQKSDGTYPKSEWVVIDGDYYYFDSHGYMATGWFTVNGKYYYNQENGKQHLGWLLWGGKYYYLDEKQGGAMLSNGFHKVGEWYLFDESGALRTGEVITIEPNGKIFV